MDLAARIRVAQNEILTMREKTEEAKKRRKIHVTTLSQDASQIDALIAEKGSLEAKLAELPN